LAPRSRKRGRRERPVAAAPAMSRSEARNEAARAQLKPLAPGERPTAVTVGAILAALVGGYNLAAFLLGTKLHLDGRRPGAVGVLLFALVMFVCAAGMWRMRYWAVLGFQALLAILILIASVLLITVSNLAGLAFCLAILAIGGTLFVKLVRTLGRMQVPVRERR
jgi:hypothetical protein